MDVLGRPRECYLTSPALAVQVRLFAISATEYLHLRRKRGMPGVEGWEVLHTEDLQS